jgi:hypothetical protein
MSIFFAHEADILLLAFAKLIQHFQEKQYLFVAKCIWRISGLVQLKPALDNYPENKQFPLANTMIIQIDDTIGAIVPIP